MPVTDRYRADPRYQDLGPDFFDIVEAARFPQVILRFRNDRWAARVGLEELDSEEWIAHFARFEPLSRNLAVPLALRYHGHQFRHYNPQIGDGRGFLYAQLRDSEDDRLLDLSTKGSGRTPWSRSGDGRLTLKGGVREILATEMLEALGCYTSKSFSLIETGEALMRGDEPSPTRSSVLVRLSHSHLRIGSFQRLAFLGESDNLKKLVDYGIDHYWPMAREAEDPVAEFYRLSVGAVAEMAAEWLVAGFVHGVLNTDNTVITGESFDYGPWRFLPTGDPNFTAAYFDENGLYAFGRQPQAVHWNLIRLLECLLPLSSHERLVTALETFGPRFERHLQAMTLARLGLAGEPGSGPVKELVSSFYEAQERTRIGYERAFFDLVGGALPERLQASPYKDAYESKPWPAVISQIRAMPLVRGARVALAHDYFNRDQPVTMLIDEMEAIWAPIAADDDWLSFNRTIADIRQMGAAYAPLLASVRRGGFVNG